MFASGVSSSPAAGAISGGFDAPEPHFESRIRDPFTGSARRDPYRDDRGPPHRPEPTTIGGAGPHTLLSRGTRRLRGARERPLKPPTRPREHLYRPAGARGHARLPAPTPSAALAAAAAAGIVPSFSIMYLKS